MGCSTARPLKPQPKRNEQDAALEKDPAQQCPVKSSLAGLEAQQAQQSDPPETPATSVGQDAGFSDGGVQCEGLPMVSRANLRRLTRQAAGHGGVLKLRESGADDQQQPQFVLKKLEAQELVCYEELYKSDSDPLHQFVALYGGEVRINPRISISSNMDMTPSQVIPDDVAVERFIQLSNLLHGFDQPFVLDMKLGVRSFVESECASDKPRADLFKRMLDIDPSEPSDEEKAQGFITKHRWMSWRDRLSSSYTLGFRIDGVAGPGSFKLKATDFVNVREENTVTRELLDFLPPPRWRSSEDRKAEGANPSREPKSIAPPAGGTADADPANTSVLEDKLVLAQRLRDRLVELREACEESPFFRSHEFIGSSLLMAAESNPPKADVFLIDFAKTFRLPDDVRVTHRLPWELGNHEDGFLIGVDNCIRCWERAIEMLKQDLASAKGVYSYSCI